MRESARLLPAQMAFGAPASHPAPTSKANAVNSPALGSVQLVSTRSVLGSMRKTWPSLVPTQSEPNADDDVLRRPADGKRRCQRARLRVDARDRPRTVVRVDDPHPVVRGRHVGGRVADGRHRRELERAGIDRSDGVRRRLEGAARAERQCENDCDDRDCEKRAAEREEATADASTPAPDGDRRRPEPERGTRVVREGVAVLVPFLRLLRERTREDRVELVVREQRSRLLLHVRPERLRLGVAPKRRPAGEQLVEHAGQGVLVGAPVHVAGANLLRREVVERPGQPPGPGRRPVDELRGQAEVAQIAVVGRIDEHVPRLHVAMDEATLVRRVERVCDLADEPDRALRRKRTIVDQCCGGRFQ